jgi:hypothetical protein
MSTSGDALTIEEKKFVFVCLFQRYVHICNPVPSQGPLHFVITVARSNNAALMMQCKSNQVNDIFPLGYCDPRFC